MTPFQTLPRMQAHPYDGNNPCGLSGRTGASLRDPRMSNNEREKAHE